MAARTTRRASKTQFVNRTQGILGAVRINRKGDEEGVPVNPGASIYLSKDEIDATAQAHEDPKNSPFVVRELIHYDQKTGEETERITCAPLERVKSQEPIAA